LLEWKSPRIHGELKKLGIEVSERTVSRILQTVKRPPSQTWKTSLQNHVGELVAIDFFAVPTIRLRVLFVVLVIDRRRRVLHFGVTEHPTAEWTGQQVIEAFSERDAKRYLIRDRDSLYGHEFRRRIQSLGMKEVVTAPRSPWQNALVERLIGSIRRYADTSTWPRNRSFDVFCHWFDYQHHSMLGDLCEAPLALE
jgi:putative transposase